MVRRFAIIVLSSLTAGCTAYLALFSKNMGQGLSVILGYVILLMSSVLMNLCIHGSTDSTKRTALLVFSLGVLVFFLGGIIYILFTSEQYKYVSPSPPVENHSTESNASDVAKATENEGTDITPTNTAPSVSEHSLTKSQEPFSSSSDIEEYHTDLSVHQPSAPSVFNTITAIDTESIIIEIEDTEKQESIVLPDADESTESVIADAIPSETSEGVPRDMTAQEHFDDFWASFYVQGEDEFLLEDGIYYMTLVINGNEIGDITVDIQDGKPSLYANEIKTYVQDTITDEAELRIFGGNEMYLTIDDFNSLGVETEFDSLGYTVLMQFSSEDMPVQILSIRTPMSRFLEKPPITDSIWLDPAVFVLSSRYSFTGNFTLNPISRFTDTLNFNLSAYNTGRLFDVNFDFNYSLRFGLDYFDFNFGSYEFNYDFEDAMIRLSWGNISTHLLSPAGTNLGIRFEKNLSYGPVNARGKSHIEQIITIEKESEIQVINEGREIFHKTLQPGNYRLQDFVLYTGANRIKIIVTPIDGSPSYEKDIELSYSSSLLAPGEIYFGGAIATGRRIVNSSSSQIAGSIRLPLWNNRSLEYDWRNVVLSGNIRMGLSKSLTLDASFALQNEVSDEAVFRPQGKLAMEFTHANILGTSRYNLNVTAETDDYGDFLLPGIYAHFGHQVYTGFSPVSSVNLGLTYETDVGDMFSDHRFSLSTSFSGGYGIFSWGLSLSGSLRTERPSDIIWSTSASASFSFSRNFYLSASASMGGLSVDMHYINGRVGATFMFSPATVNVTASTYETSAEVSIRESGHSFSAEVSTDDITTFDSYSLDADYSYSGDYVNVGFGLNASDIFDSVAGSVSLSTSSVFADGYMAFSSYLPSNFMFIVQEGGLEGNTLSAGVAGQSASVEIPTWFNVGLYRNIPRNRGTSLSLFSMGEGSFGSMQDFDVYIPASKTAGYVLHIEADRVYTIAGYVSLPDGSVWSNGSSPVYRMTVDGKDANLEQVDEYIFSDNDGLFVLSGLAPGRYAFDINTEDGEWFLCSFVVADAPEHIGEMQFIDTVVEDQSIEVSEPYSGAYSFTGNRYFMTGDEFWAMLYPEFEVAV